MKMETKMKYGRLFLAVVVLFLSTAMGAYADTAATTVTFNVPASLSFSVAYTSPCTSSNFAFIEGDATIDGTASQIPVNGTDGSACQTAAAYGTRVTNTGNVALFIRADFGSNLAQSGKVWVKVSNGSGGFQNPCTRVTGVDNNGFVTPTTCREWDMMTAAATAANISVVANGGTQDYWWWANFSSFNAGATISTTKTMTLTSGRSS